MFNGGVWNKLYPNRFANEEEARARYAQARLDEAREYAMQFQEAGQL